MSDAIVRIPVINKSYVGLDMSLSGTGVCILTGNEIKVETIKTKPDDFSNDLERLKYIVAKVMERIPNTTSMICMEDFFTPGNSAQIGSAIKLAMLGTTMRLALYDKGLPFWTIAPTQLKKWITGSGASQKSLIIMSVFKVYGREVKDDNQADSMVLAHIAKALDESSVGLPKYQLEALGKIKSDRPRYNVSL
jgi:Holliday junction resolvasome RuvABC endonuclease subunit